MIGLMDGILHIQRLIKGRQKIKGNKIRRKFKYPVMLDVSQENNTKETGRNLYQCTICNILSTILFCFLYISFVCFSGILNALFGSGVLFLKLLGEIPKGSQTTLKHYKVLHFHAILSSWIKFCWIIILQSFQTPFALP